MAIAPSWAATLTGRVVGVHDGDTFTVIDADGNREKVRLMGVDAPELRQAFGRTARAALVSAINGRDVHIEWYKRDRDGRPVGKVLYQKPCEPGMMCTQALTDANLAQLQAGLAWWYREYRREQTVEDRAIYAEAESEARARRAGLWIDPNPVPPWEWRREKRR